MSQSKEPPRKGFQDEVIQVHERMFGKYKIELLDTNELGVMTQRKPDPTDITDQQWQVLAPLIPFSKPNGRPRLVGSLSPISH